ncbi:MAG: DUF5071 domain-containing protein [Clostridia bacterium]|nr:DUF5071 domain-containing protein [Clostridia bacterium]
MEQGTFGQNVVHSTIGGLLNQLGDSRHEEVRQALNTLKSEENRIFPLVGDILRGDNHDWKCAVMRLLIPSFTREHQEALRRDLEYVAFIPSSSEDVMDASDCAEQCLEACFGYAI